MDPLTLFTIQQQSALTEHRQMAGDLGLGLVFFYPSSKYVRLEIPLDCQGFQDEYDLCGCFNVYKTSRRG